MVLIFLSGVLCIPITTCRGHMSTPFFIQLSEMIFFIKSHPPLNKQTPFFFFFFFFFVVSFFFFFLFVAYIFFFCPHYFLVGGGVGFCKVLFFPIKLNTWLTSFTLVIESKLIASTFRFCKFS